MWDLLAIVVSLQLAAISVVEVPHLVLVLPRKAALEVVVAELLVPFAVLRIVFAIDLVVFVSVRARVSCLPALSAFCFFLLRILPSIVSLFLLFFLLLLLLFVVVVGYCCFGLIMKIMETMKVMMMGYVEMTGFWVGLL